MALIFLNIIVDQIWLKATIFGLLMWGGLGNLRFLQVKQLTWVNTNTLTWELICTVTWVNLEEPSVPPAHAQRVYTNTLMCELIGTVTWVYTNKPTWELNRYRRRTRPDRTRHPLKTFQ